jgi:hypothetical protein
MATIVQGGPDLRKQALEGGVQSGIENYFAAKKKKQAEQKFLDAFKSVNGAASYEDAVKAMATADREILANPQSVQMLNDQINRKFPAQEALEVIDPVSKQRQTITHRKGAPPSDQELAKHGLTRQSSTDIGSQFSLNQDTGEVGVMANSTPQEAQEAAAPGSLVMQQAEVAPAAALMNAYSARVKAKQAGTKANKPDKATQFDQEVTATASRMGLDPTNPADRNKAVNVVTLRGSTIKDFRDFYTKSAGGEIFFTDDIARGHMANAEQIAEPALAQLDSPETAKKLMTIDASYQIANDPAIESTMAKDRAANDFMRLTGMAPGDAILQQVMKQAESTLDDGQIVERPVKDKSGKQLYTIRIMKIGGRVIPLARAE